METLWMLFTVMQKRYQITWFLGTIELVGSKKNINKDKNGNSFRAYWGSVSLL